MNSRGKLAEGPGMCFFMVRGGVAITPEVTADVLESITRDTVLGLLTPNAGQVLVDGQDIGENLRAWQDQIGYVPQTIYLTDESLRANIAFGLPEDEHVTIEVFNLVGQRVALLLNEPMAAGRHEVAWQATNLPSGLYLVRLRAGAIQKIQRVMLVK